MRVFEKGELGRRGRYGDDSITFPDKSCATESLVQTALERARPLVTDTLRNFLSSSPMCFSIDDFINFNHIFLDSKLADLRCIR